MVKNKENDDKYHIHEELVLGTVRTEVRITGEDFRDSLVQLSHYKMDKLSKFWDSASVGLNYYNEIPWTRCLKP